MSDLVIPDWVPDAVREMSRLQGIRSEIHDRLLTSAGMKQVWKTLSQRKVERENLNQLGPWLNIGEYGVPVGDFTNAEIASAAYFRTACIELWREEFVLTESLRSESDRKWEEVQGILEYHLQYCKTAPTVTMEAGAQASFEDVVKYIKDLREGLIKLKGPFVLNKSSGERNSDTLRIKACSLVNFNKLLFGTFLDGTVASTINIALNPEKKISAQTVRKWREAMLSHEAVDG